MMTLSNYGFGFSKHKDSNSVKVLSKSLQIRNRAELALKQQLKNRFKLTPDKRNDIIHSLVEYYSRLPFNVVIWNKYQTKHCINDSIFLDSKFNPYKAKEAFRLVEEMLINLVHLPWHNEFHKIYTYSGHYRQNINAPLIGVEEVFKAAGFEESPDCSMHLILPDGKMPQVDDSEAVFSVIFDCMIAQVICLDIIDVFENICKTSKLNAANYCDSVNCYPWIQNYFKERTDQITDRACNSIQESLNIMSVQLTKLDLNNSDSRIQSNNLTGDPTHIGYKGNSPGTKDQLKQNAQMKSLEFFSQHVNGSDNLLSNDLLRIPSTTKDLNYNRRKIAEQNHTTASIRSSHLRPSNSSELNRANLTTNGFNVNQHSHDFTDCLHHISSNLNNREKNDFSTAPGHRLVEIDTPHNDKEPLIPRYDRRPMSLYHTNSYNGKRSGMYDVDSFVNPIPSRSNGSNHFGHQLASDRDNFHGSHVDYDRHHQSTSQSVADGQGRGLSSSRYPSSSQRRYESRNSVIDNNPLSGNKTYWSCSSCTYNNLISSEVCDMCRKHRPLH